MAAVVLDTDVFSFFLKQDTRARLYEDAVRDRQACLCFQTVAEIKFWAISRNWGEPRRRGLDQALQHYLVLPYDGEMADTWARISGERKWAGRRIECGDAWIAAAAVRHGIPLLSHNGSHYEGISGLELITAIE
jgi:predicted nucleic acid-binding protein